MLMGSIIYNLQVLIGLFVFIFTIKKYPYLLKVDVKQVIRFTIACVTLFSLQGIAYSFIREISYIDQSFLEGINSLMGVWWEDACFVLPYLLLYNRFGKKAYFALPLFILTSFYFSLGHLYQGPTGYVTFLFPFISFYYAKKYGAGTTMLCHIIYDTSIIVCMVLMKIIILGLF